MSFHLCSFLALIKLKWLQNRLARLGNFLLLLMFRFDFNFLWALDFCPHSSEGGERGGWLHSLGLGMSLWVDGMR